MPQKDHCFSFILIHLKHSIIKTLEITAIFSHICTFCILFSFILRHVCNMEAKSSAQKGHIRRFLTRCLPIALMLAKFVHVSDQEFLCSPFFGKFAVKRDWNSKVSQNVQNLLCFGKIDGSFRKKTLNFFKIGKHGNFFGKSVSNGIISKKCPTSFERFLG